MKKICECCGEEINEKFHYEEIEGKYICEDCLIEDEEHASTVILFNSKPFDYYDTTEDGEGLMCRVGKYINDTNGEFNEEYRRIDGWGEYSVLTSEEWVPIHEDAALSYSEDERNLKKFDEHIRKIFKARNIPLAIAICETSNLFCAGVDYFTKKENEEEVKSIIKRLEDLYRDPWKFASTALTGKDPEDQNREDKLFTLIAKEMIK